MAQPVRNVLFLCTGNSARSILAECLLNRHGAGRFRAYSAGSHPRGEIHPMTLQLLQEQGHETSGLRSKSWDDFATPGAPQLDFVFTVCEDAAREACPVWPGQPVTAHWSIEDPVRFSGPADEQRSVFRRVYADLEDRIQLFIRFSLGLPRSSL